MVIIRLGEGSSGELADECYWLLPEPYAKAPTPRRSPVRVHSV